MLVFLIACGAAPPVAVVAAYLLERLQEPASKVSRPRGYASDGPSLLTPVADVGEDALCFRARDVEQLKCANSP